MSQQECNERWRAKNPEYVKEYRTEYHKKNKKEERKYRRDWDKTDKGKARNQRNHITRRVYEGKVINTLTSQEWIDILEKYNYRCAYCNMEFDCENLPERDHIIPISKGGNNIKENIIPSCRICNAKKKDKILIKKGVDYNDRTT
jgi:5-methylcytosine-specific restriction endonuclease McrA